MGTHSFIIMRAKTDVSYITYCKLYQQFDGYLDGVGLALVKFLLSKKMVNGMSGNPNEANGASCLFAQIVAHFKQGPGNAYLEDPNSSETEEYNYYVDVGAYDISVTLSYHGTEFSGTCQEVLEYINKNI